MTIQAVLRPDGFSAEPRGAVFDHPPADDAVLREMTELLRNAHPGLLASVLIVPVVIVGVAIEGTVLHTKLLHAGLGTVLSLGLLAVLMVTVVRAAVLTILAGRPLLDQLGELRREIGAPVDPYVPWTPMRNRAAISEAPGWDRVRAIVAAAHFHNFRAHAALTWAILAIICFFTWTVVTLAVT